MFNTLIQEVKKGDFIRLFLISGKEPEGEIIEIGENHLLILNKEGLKQRFFDKLIGGWEVLYSAQDSKEDHMEKANDKKEIKEETGTNEGITEHKEEIITNAPSGLKILGKIDLDKFEKKKKPKTKSPTFNSDSTKNQQKENELSISGRFGSFEELGRVIAEKDKNKLVPANAYIIKHSEERGFGFLRDPFEIDIYFNYNDIIDDELRKKIKGVRQYLNIQVCCSLSKNWKGEKAVSIHLPWTIEKSIQVAEDFIKSKDFLNSKNIAEQILKAFPGNIDAEGILKILENKRKAIFYRPKGFDSIYYKAKKAKESKNYDEAIKLYIESIEDEEKLDSSVKDLAATYQELGEIDKGIALLEKYIDQLPDNSATYNFASNYYSTAGEFEKSNKFLDQLEKITPNSKLPDLYSRKAFCLIQLEKFDEALAYVEEILHMRKENPVALKMKEKLEDAIKTGIYEKLDSFVDDTDFSSFTGGLPQILCNALENCDYAGLTANVISQKAFSKTHLRQIRKLISEAGKSRPKERAKYLLTESRLVQVLDPENEDELRSSLSRYCTAKAISYQVEKYNPEISRYYYLLSFELENKLLTNVRQVYFYLISYLNKPFKIQKTLRIEELLDKGIYELLANINFNDNVWNGIIDLMISNSQISAVIVDKFTVPDSNL